jgi:hypothetical protein
MNPVHCVDNFVLHMQHKVVQSSKAQCAQKFRDFYFPSPPSREIFSPARRFAGLISAA